MMMDGYFKSDEELRAYLKLDVPNSEYTGAFKSKEAARKYFQEQGLSIEDQEFIDSSLGGYSKDSTNTSVSVNGSVSGIYKSKVNSWLNPSKLRLISRLNECSSFTPEKEVASLLEELFNLWPSAKWYWPYIARTYPPRVINWVVSMTVKAYKRGSIRKTPVAFFSNEIKHRMKHKRLRGTNGIRKQLDTTKS